MRNQSHNETTPTTKEFFSLKRKAALAVAAGILATTSACGGGSSESTRGSESTDTALSNSNEAEKVLTNDPTELVGTMQLTYENLNMKAPEDVVERATEPTLITDYTDTEALIDLSRKANVYNLSGELLDTQGEQFETEESNKNGKRILDVLLSSTAPEELRSEWLELRKGVALRTQLFGNEKNVNLENGESEYVTFNTSYSNVERISKTPTSSTFYVRAESATNYDLVNGSEAFMNNNIKSGAADLHVTIVKEDGEWKYDSRSYQ